MHKAEKSLTFVFRTSNEVYFKWEMPMDRAVVNDLRTDDRPEVKLIKHVCANDKEISERFK